MISRAGHIHQSMLLLRHSPNALLSGKWNGTERGNLETKSVFGGNVINVAERETDGTLSEIRS